ncbi:DNA recombinase [Methylophilales phage Venkman EXVC282S]|nr:DNA recombinase [Methylophilales phage Venkman EXVC282S]
MSLYRNINKRKKAGTSRTKKKSTISKSAYANMKAGFPKKKKKKAKA